MLLVMSMLFMVSYVYIIFHSTVMILEYELFNLSSVSMSFAMIIDGISISFGAVVTIISACVFMFAVSYMSEDEYFSRFIWLLLSFVVSMNLLIFSGSLFSVLLGWDGLGITSFALIIYYQSNQSLYAGYKTLMINRIGDAVIVVSTAVFVIFGQLSVYSMTNSMWLLVFILSVAGLTKSAQYPFSSWLPAAMAAPTPVSALVHSSTLVTAGIYLIIRLSTNMPLSQNLLSFLLVVGSITCLLGGWAASVENDLKKIIALSTLSQLGVMVFSLGLGSSVLALFHLYTHAMFKALLFLSAGAFLYMSFGTQDIRLLGSIGPAAPVVVVMFNLSSLCLLGAPFLSAFYSKHTILEMAYSSGSSVIALIIMGVGTAFTGKYVVRSLKAISWGNCVQVGSLSSPSLLMVLPMVILGAGGIMCGKMFMSLNPGLLSMVFIPSYFSMVVNFLTLSGVIIGLILDTKVSSHVLSSMFFLVPSFMSSSKVLSPLVKGLKNLDHGWLEPSSLFGFRPHQMSYFSSLMLSWPLTPGVIGRGGFIVIML
uniref:NADH-ubiquinone oxidoreductase chain 5 n=1 Tax=Onchidella borealis TaxID=244421 RepID=E6Y1C1_9EUPU|nr:NADH dehydrogenase subunit 5 [Onchidella borealis]